MIKLNQRESLLFNLFKEYLQTSKKQIELRVAGGWVRDKLLNLESNDIDIAIDNQLGIHFCAELKKFLIKKQIDSSSFSVIKKNPEQSKHLEIATIKIYDYQIDFVNLRSINYAKNQQENFGSPKEDALLRDLTINALFYNINKDCIEDFTESGLYDLQNNIIRTPIDPYLTFKDDPLRILRCFRFASRFDFSLSEEIIQTIQNKNELKDQIQKITKERVGKEFLNTYEKQTTLKPFKFFQLVQQFQYFQPIFQVPENVLQNNFQFCKELEQQLQNNDQYFQQLLQEFDLPYQVKIMLCHITLLLTYKLDDKNCNFLKTKNNLGYQIVQNNLKFSKKHCQFVGQLQCSLFHLNQFLSKQNQQQNIQQFYGLWIKYSQYFYRISIYLLCCIMKKDEKLQQQILQQINNMNLKNFHLKQPLFTGLEVRQIFNVQGSSIKQKLDEILLWQIQNPLKDQQDYLKAFNLQLNQFISII